MEPSRIDWKSLTDKLPVSKSKADKAQRIKIFNGWDPNGNGYLSLAEIDKGILDLGLKDLFNSKPAIIKAFNSAKDYGDQQG